ncbi:hypothetical protein ASE01_04535 [Nocardioides sp. Root190]|uniref:hypothetical protein n=1 Tax=Nocardioides sp. Root190 TaxID=1736488 RepID=UPI000701C42A|nr:hypothetical protein [Nocardioides sp. Root190]KRB78532.1 hypothetical protein ASE01_04535 [Nocardioides sp. Root190]
MVRNALRVAKRSSTKGAGALLVLGIALAATGCGSEEEPARDEVSADSDPLAKDCALLVGEDGLVDQALAHADGTDAIAVAEREATQQGLFQVVSEGAPELSDPAGQLVDFLDDVTTYVSSEDLMAEVRDAADEIDRTCGVPQG